jgi:very-short-patch-repair endonuclease
MRHRQPSFARSQLLAQRATEMRIQLNPAEAALWAQLKGGAVGVMFRRTSWCWTGTSLTSWLQSC